MNGGARLREIREGLARLLVPDVPRGKGPGKCVGVPFYNPTMEKSRDMTVLFLRALKRPGIGVFDGLAATGAMGIRVALEVPGARVTSNDGSPEAVELIAKNAELNDVKLEGIVNARFQEHLSRNSYAVIDVDPFGTPAAYLDSAFQAAPRDGVVCVTATDTAVLCGAQARTCVRRYDAVPLHIDCCKEIALRILIGFCCRTAARYDKAAAPLLSYSADHYLRTFMGVEHGARRADERLASLGYVVYDRETGDRRLVRERPTSSSWAGPLWAGVLSNGSVVKSLAPMAYMGHGTSALVSQLKAEVDSPALFTTSEFIARLAKSSPPPMSKLVEELMRRGFTATRTHFDAGGVKTDAPWGELVGTSRQLSA